MFWVNFYQMFSIWRVNWIQVYFIQLRSQSVHCVCIFRIFLCQRELSLCRLSFFFCAGVETDDQSIDAVRGPQPHLIWPPHHRHSGLFLPVPEADVKGFNGELVLLCSASVWIVKISASWYLVNKQYLFFFLFSSQEILHSYGNTASTVQVIATVFGYLDRKPECKTAGEFAPEALEGRVVFQDVTFTYPSADKPALKVTFWQFRIWCWLRANTACRTRRARWRPHYQGKLSQIVKHCFPFPSKKEPIGDLNWECIGI